MFAIGWRGGETAAAVCRAREVWAEALLWVCGRLQAVMCYRRRFSPLRRRFFWSGEEADLAVHRADVDDRPLRSPPNPAPPAITAHSTLSRMGQWATIRTPYQH